MTLLIFFLSQKFECNCESYLLVESKRDTLF